MEFVETIPGLRRGHTVKNIFVGGVYLCLLLVWPLLLGYGVLINYNGVAKLFNWIPGVSEDGGPVSGIIVGFLSAPIVYFILAPLTGGFAGLGLFVGIVLVFGMISTGYFRAWWKLRSSDPDSLLTVSSGPVELEGTACPDEQTITAPYTNTESLLCEYEKERRQREEDEDGNVEYTWNTVSSGVKSTQFILESDGHEILIDPERMERMLGQDYRDRTGNTRVRENRLDPDDSVYVAGVATEHSDTDDDWSVSDHRLVITAPESDLPSALRRVHEPPAIVSDSSESGVLFRLFGRGVVFVILTAVFSYPVFVTIQGTFL